MTKKRRRHRRLHKSKRGRPRLYDATPSPEALAKRLALAGMHGDPTKTSHPVDWLETRGIIDEREAIAGRRFHTLRLISFGPSDITAFEIGGVTGYSLATFDERAIESARAEYETLCSLLRRRSAQIFSDTVDLCIYAQWPIPEPDTLRYAEKIERLREGLGTIADHLTKAQSSRRTQVVASKARNA